MSGAGCSNREHGKPLPRGPWYTGIPELAQVAILNLIILAVFVLLLVWIGGEL